MPMSVDDIELQEKPPSRRRAWWQWLLWGLLLVILLAAIVAGFLWVNRYEILEDAALDILAEQGIEAELSIKSASQTQAILTDITLSDDGKPFFSAKEVTADYQWRELLKGHAEKLVFKHPKARLTLDAQGKIIDGWLPPQSEGGQSQINFPPQGIKIDSGVFTIVSPYGPADIDVDGAFFAADNFTARLNIAPTTFSYGDWRMAGGGKLDIALQGEDAKIESDLTLSKLEHPVIDAKDLRITGNMVPSLGNDLNAVTGDMDFSFSEIIMAQAVIGEGELSWQGRIEHNSLKKHPLAFDGDWRSKLGDVVLPDPQRRRNLANVLSLSEPLGKAPVAQNFSAELTRNMMGLLTRSDISGAGRAELNESGLSVALGGPVQMTAKDTALTLTQTDWAPLYRFDRDAGKVRLAFHADLTQPAGLSLRESDMVARSSNGWRLDGVERFSADVSTTTTWRSQDKKGRPARLAPFIAQTVYKAEGARRELLLTGGVDYDGKLPGGYVTDMQTSGRMNMIIQGDENVISFKPDNNAPIVLSRVETDTEWRGEEVSARLISTGPIYKRKGDVSSINAELADISLIAIDRTDTKNLGMTFSEMSVSAELSGENQNWKMAMSEAKICSEDVPGPGTDIRMPNMKLELWRDTDVPLRFEMSAPTANAKTQLVNAAGLEITAKGTPQNYEMSYNPGIDKLGRVKFTGDALPRLPMTGIVNYKNGTFAGTARTHLPFSEDTPIDVSYRFEDGAGTADVDIPQLLFTPKGLQPQYLISALRGKIADVDGSASAKIKLAFAAGQPMQSFGTARLNGMNFGTLPGPLSDVNSEMSFSSFFPLQSQGRQRITVALFDPGFPLQDGVIEFELIPDGVKVYSARWPMGTGFISLDPFDWLYSAPENRVVMRLEKVSLGEFLKDVGNGSLEATGDIEGILPIVLSGIDVKVAGGFLEVKDGGTIKYQSPQTSAAGASNEYAKMAFEALQDFQYRSLTAKIDGPLDGAIDVGMEFDGSNKDVLNNQPFRFDIGIQGELLNIIRSFNTNGQIKSELARRGLAKEEIIPDLE